MTLIPYGQRKNAIKCLMRVMKKLPFIKHLLYPGAKQGGLCVSSQTIF